MSRVDHVNSKVTFDVCAQLEQRVDRRHGTAFGALIRAARREFTAFGSESAARGGKPKGRKSRRPASP